MMGIVDYGAGNLQSVANALDRLGEPFVVCTAPGQLDGVERAILPGVGHFGAAARGLRESGLAARLVRFASEGGPLLGICLGMQLLLEASDEADGAPGLGLLRGRNRRLEARTVPHMGWNRVRWCEAGRAAWAFEAGHFYFAHGFVAEPAVADDVLATVELDGRELPAAIGKGRVLGVQFHPEKSADLGLALLEGFCRC